IEDEADVAESIKMLLEMNGYKADYNLNPKAAIKKAKEYDLILLDIMMPIMSGREVLAEFKKMKLKVPVLVVTAVGMPFEIERELSAKYFPVRVLPKTSIHTDLIKEIKKILKE
ncbi:MAG: response regulator, partial [Candidatus Micrarchaeota archaeon]|nr:response regulator [Candidatus Micrarchaeota archaeon]